MSLFKEKKLKHSTPKTKFRVTIDAKHKDKMQEFENNKLSLSDLESKLNNQNFIKKAPEEVIISTKIELKNIQKEIFEINKALEGL